MARIRYDAPVTQLYLASSTAGEEKGQPDGALMTSLYNVADRSRMGTSIISPRYLYGIKALHLPVFFPASLGHIIKTFFPPLSGSLSSFPLTFLH